MTVGAKIKKFRVAQGLSQKQLAIMAGMSEPAVRNYELGNRTPSAGQLERLAAALKLSPFAISDPDLDSFHGVMQALFTLEDTYGLRPAEIDGQVVLCLDKSKKPEAGSLRDDLRDWLGVSIELERGELSREEYDVWRYSYPGGKAERLRVELDGRRRQDGQGGWAGRTGIGNATKQRVLFRGIEGNKSCLLQRSLRRFLPAVLLPPGQPIQARIHRNLY
jgi:transcriptional regulator with XRE-family HTH domain